MTDQHGWTPTDDESLRTALGTLRHEVEAHPLPDVRFVMARGDARRRRRRRHLVGAAAASVAVLALGYGGFRAADPSATVLQPAGTVPADTTQGDPSVPLAAPGPLPLSAEWGRALGSTGVVRLVPAPSDQPVPGGCELRPPGTPERADSVRGELAGWHGEQVLYEASSRRAGDTAAQQVARSVQACPGASVTETGSPSSWPRVLRVQGSGGAPRWVVVAHAGPRTTVLAASGLPRAGDQQEGVAHLASVAQQRLERPSGSPSGPGTAPTGPGAPTTSAPAHSDEAMHVVGPRPLLSPELFVPASGWSATALSDGAPTRSVTGDWEGQAALTECDADTARDGTPGAGRFGIVSVATATDGTFVGKQRVRLTADGAAAATERSRLVRALRSCAGTVEGMQVTPDPEHPAAFRLDFDNPYGGPVLTTWVAVTTQRTVGAVSTFAVTGPVTGGDGFAELQRLVSFARQR